MARKELRNYIKSKASEIAKARTLFSSDRRLNHRQRDVVLQAAKNPDRIFFISDHLAKHGIAYGTARRDLLQLVDWEYLRLEAVGKRFEFLVGPKVSELSGPSPTSGQLYF
jgi:hypothetical protein